MPNWCEVDCQINFPDETEKKKLQVVLDAEIAKAKAEDKGLFVGCKEKYLFFSAYSDDETEILITGDVKWSLQPEEMADWVRWFCSHAKISEITAKYNEAGFRCAFLNLSCDFIFRKNKNLICNVCQTSAAIARNARNGSGYNYIFKIAVESFRIQT